MSENNLKRLYSEHGQSPWLDNLRRDWIESGELEKWIENGCRGITSNPTIFAKAMSDKSAYDEELLELKSETSTEHIYWQLVMNDIRSALQMLHPIFVESNGLDGYVSVEVSPLMANDADATIEAALELHKRIDAPNLYIKVPATQAGIAAIEDLVARGININVTLIFSLKRYSEVMTAYISGLERLAETDKSKLANVHSVASFFVSRVDTEVDRRLEAINTEDALSLRGKAAVAQAQAAYQLFLNEFEGERFQKLAEVGANLQRPLWASVSTKNPDYSDTLYIDTLIGPDTVSTMPEDSLSAFLDHGTLERTVDAQPNSHKEILSQLEKVGINMDDVSATLEEEGVSAFAKSYEEALTTLDTQKAELES